MTPNSVMRAALAALGVVLSIGCVQPATAALIEVQSDLGDALTRVEVEIRDARDERVSDRFAFDAVANAKYRVPFTFRVMRGPELTRQFVVRATGFNWSTFLAQAKLRITMVADDTVRRTVLLLEACRDLMCADGSSCDPSIGSCIPVFAASPRAGGDGMAEEAAAGFDGGDAAPSAAMQTAGDEPPPPAADGGRGESGAGAEGGMGGVGSSAGAGGASGSKGGSGAGGSAGRSVGPDSGQGVLSAPSDIAQVIHDGRSYVIQNNVFDPSSSQTVSYQSTSFQVTSIRGANPSGVSLPSVYIGSLWTIASRNSNLPRAVRDIQSVDVTFVHNAGSVAGTYNALHAFWFSKSAAGDSSNPTGGFLEVWYHTHPDQQPVGERIATAQAIAGMPGRWDVWVGTFDSHPVIVYLRTEPVTDVHANLQPFLADAVTRPNAISSSWYLTGVITGFEIHAGGVGLVASEIASEVH